MPKGPNGEKRPADAIGLAVMIGKIATGEIEDSRESLSSAAAEREGRLARQALVLNGGARLRKKGLLRAGEIQLRLRRKRQS